MLFIFYSLQALDEMIEFANVIIGVNKGALGVLFELKDLMGVFLTFYITWFVNNHQVINTESSPEMQKDFTKIYNWLHMNYTWMYISIFWSMITWISYKNMDRRAEEFNRFKGFLM